MRQALFFLAMLLGLALLILMQLDPLAQALGVASLLLVVTYPLAKRVTWWPQLMLGFTFGWGAPMGYAAAAGRLDLAAAALYGAAILWILGYDTIYAHQDREDDALVGVRSTARLFASRTRPFLAACYAGAVLLLALAGGLAGLSWPFYAALALACCYARLADREIDIDDPAFCLRLFQRHRDVGLAIGARHPARPVVTGEAFLRANTVPATRAAGPGDHPASGERDHPDLAGDRGLAAANRHRAAVLGLRVARQPGTGAPYARQSRDNARASECWISPPAAASRRSPRPGRRRFGRRR